MRNISPILLSPSIHFSHVRLPLFQHGLRFMFMAQNQTGTNNGRLLVFGWTLYFACSFSMLNNNYFWSLFQHRDCVEIGEFSCVWNQFDKVVDDLNVLVLSISLPSDALNGRIKNFRNFFSKSDEFSEYLLVRARIFSYVLTG